MLIIKKEECSTNSSYSVQNVIPEKLVPLESDRNPFNFFRISCLLSAVVFIVFRCIFCLQYFHISKKLSDSLPPKVYFHFLENTHSLTLICVHLIVEKMLNCTINLTKLLFNTYEGNVISKTTDKKRTTSGMQCRHVTDVI
jgi:hypothetical protein